MRLVVLHKVQLVRGTREGTHLVGSVPARGHGELAGGQVVKAHHHPGLQRKEVLAYCALRLLHIDVHGRVADHDRRGIAPLLQMPDGAEDVQMPARAEIEVGDEPQQGIWLGLPRQGLQFVGQSEGVVPQDVGVVGRPLAQAAHHGTYRRRNAFLARHFPHAPDFVCDFRNHGQAAPARCNCSSRDTERNTHMGNLSWRVPRY